MIVSELNATISIYKDYVKYSINEFDEIQFFPG